MCLLRPAAVVAELATAVYDYDWIDGETTLVAVAGLAVVRWRLRAQPPSPQRLCSSWTSSLSTGRLLSALSFLHLVNSLIHTGSVVVAVAGTAVVGTGTCSSPVHSNKDLPFQVLAGQERYVESLV